MKIFESHGSWTDQVVPNDQFLIIGLLEQENCKARYKSIFKIAIDSAFIIRYIVLVRYLVITF